MHAYMDVGYLNKYSQIVAFPDQQQPCEEDLVPFDNSPIVVSRYPQPLTTYVLHRIHLSPFARYPYLVPMHKFDRKSWQTSYGKVEMGNETFFCPFPIQNQSSSSSSSTKMPSACIAFSEAVCSALFLLKSSATAIFWPFTITATLNRSRFSNL